MPANKNRPKYQTSSNTIAIKQIPADQPPSDKRSATKIQMKQQKGRFQKIRTTMNTGLVLLFLLLPFITYGDRQAILFDLEAQQFFFFGTSLWPQDFTVLAWVFIAAAFLLFFVTVFWGRVWCGYLCPQTAWTFMFAWIENRVEGNRTKRLALDNAPWSSDKLFKRLTKHLIWGLTALITGCAFIAYFIPARELYLDIFSLNASFWVSAWVWFFALCTYLNAGWMREQMCLHCCPYARFQSAMFDGNTKTVTYDAARGESRGPRKRKQETELGDCIDCNLCVDVCPTGIDIRNGLQYECINCGACVDACNETMEIFGYRPNLIGYFSENALKGKPKPIFGSTKFIGYGIAAVIMFIVIAIDMNGRSDIQLNVIRDRQELYRETVDDMVENSYTLKIRNKTQQTRYYRLSVDNRELFTLSAQQELVIKAGELLDYPVTVKADPLMLPGTPTPIIFSISEVGRDETAVSQETNFFGPIFVASCR
ncbi:cytochrome c oxidase accessory protein CcoG [Shewanella atlantica]|uniref:cytochrome c oxidase accessory protein CcoG n=1 Tax=Shewanella atlantica TaxID=271099 RepID=UPI0037355BDB